MGGGTATYTYNALNQRVRIDAPGSDSIEFAYNIYGQRVSTWDANTGNQIQGQVYWGSTPVEFHGGGAAHFETQDWEGTERMQTSYNGAVEGIYASLPFGDGYSTSGTDDDAYHFAGLDQDNSANEHAMYREYSNMAGRWMSPDPYSGSYNLSNPQSMNRYAYVMNNPLAFIDPLGLLECYSTGGSWSISDSGDPLSSGNDPVITICTSPIDDGGGNNSYIGGGSGGGSSAAPNNSIFHSLVCSLFSSLLNEAASSGTTVGEGAGGGAGAGALLGFNVAGGVQVVADPSGNLGVAFTFNGTFPGPVLGIGAIGGGQVSVSNAQNIDDLNGQAVDIGATFGDGPAVGVDVSRAPGGIYTGTLTLGVGVGTKGAAASQSNTWVPSVLSTNCK